MDKCSLLLLSKQLGDRWVEWRKWFVCNVGEQGGGGVRGLLFSYWLKDNGLVKGGAVLCSFTAEHA
ncbi:MAG TPA: hypothetical protein VGN44_05865 [Candidatus Angelobacter sp.]|jgi:hypothetical protein